MIKNLRRTVPAAAFIVLAIVASLGIEESPASAVTISDQSTSFDYVLEVRLDSSEVAQAALGTAEADQICWAQIYHQAEQMYSSLISYPDCAIRLNACAVQARSAGANAAIVGFRQSKTNYGYSNTCQLA